MKKTIFIVKQHPSPHGIVVVITDKEILGKSFEEGKLQLDLSKDFYKGDTKTKDEVLKILEKAYVVHLTGKNAIDLGIDLGIINVNRILFIGGIPHAEGYLG